MKKAIFLGLLGILSLGFVKESNAEVVGDYWNDKFKNDLHEAVEMYQNGDKIYKQKLFELGRTFLLKLDFVQFTSPPFGRAIPMWKLISQEGLFNPSFKINSNLRAASSKFGCRKLYKVELKSCSMTWRKSIPRRISLEINTLF